MLNEVVKSYKEAYEELAAEREETVKSFKEAILHLPKEYVEEINNPFSPLSEDYRIMLPERFHSYFLDAAIEKGLEYTEAINKVDSSLEEYREKWKEVVMQFLGGSLVTMIAVLIINLFTIATFDLSTAIGEIGLFFISVGAVNLAATINYKVMCKKLSFGRSLPRARYSIRYRKKDINGTLWI